MRFSFTEREGEKTVESELVENITAELQREFHAEVIDVVVKPLDTEIVTRLRTLQATISPLQVRVDTLHMVEPIFFNGSFQVQRVHQSGWYKFQSQACDIETIKLQLEQELLAALQSD